MTTVTRRQLFTHAQSIGVEITEETGGGFRHFHAYSPVGKIFIGSTCHNTGLGDAYPGDKPEWGFMLNEIEIEDCGAGKSCETCYPTDD